MNALYVTVSIPLLLLLAGFNHAHGLTTFGKTSTNTNPQPVQPPGIVYLLYLPHLHRNHPHSYGGWPYQAPNIPCFANFSYRYHFVPSTKGSISIRDSISGKVVNRQNARENHPFGLRALRSVSNNPWLAKPCSNHTVCKGILGASCVQDPKDTSRKGCLCGDNKPPINGACTANYKGPSHLCSETKECVEGAQCLDMSKKNTEKVCKCMDGLVEEHNMCSGGTPTSVLSGLLILLAITRTILY